MLITVMESAHPKVEMRELFFHARVGTIDEETDVEAELDGNNQLRLMLKKYTNAEWDETRHFTELLIDQDRMEIIRPMGFCLNREQREKLISIFHDRQYYGMTGWEFAKAFVEEMCRSRGIKAPELKEPDFSGLPILEEGARGIYDRWYSGPEVYRLMFPQVEIELGNNAFAFAVSNEGLEPEKLYFKVCEFVEPVMSSEYRTSKDDEVHHHYGIENFDEIRRWCRISLKRAEYITGSDECMMLNREQREKFNQGIRKRWGEIVHDFNSFVSYKREDVEDLNEDYPIPDYMMLPIEEG